MTPHKSNLYFAGSHGGAAKTLISFRNVLILLEVYNKKWALKLYTPRASAYLASHKKSKIIFYMAHK